MLSSLKLWSGDLATPKIHFRTELNREQIIKKNKCSYTNTVYTTIYIFIFNSIFNVKFERLPISTF